MKIFIIQSKGGVGKSLLTKLLSLKADRDQSKTYFIDCDNASASTTKFFKSIEDKKAPHILFKSENLVGTDKKIDRTKFDSFLDTVQKLDNVVCDFGAASSDQFLFYLQEESRNGIVGTLEELGIKLFLVMVGGGSIKESIDYALALRQIEDIGGLVKIVANEYLGGVNGQSVKEYTKADIQITSLHEDINSEAQQEWNNLLNSGIVFSEIQTMSVIRRKRILSYLDSIFNQINLHV